MQGDNSHSPSFELGLVLGSKDAQIHGVLSEKEIKTLSLLAYHKTKRALILDLVDFGLGYISGYAGFLNGIV
jgi:hypothetical protein